MNTTNLRRIIILKASFIFLLITAAFNSYAVSGIEKSHHPASVINKNKKVLSRDSIIKILAVGNSFSEDAIEYYLHGLAKAGGYKVIIGNLYIGGAPLDLHWKNASEDKAVYNYRKIDTAGNKEKKPKIKISQALADEDWDFISLQQASSKSGLYETYTEPLPLLFQYIKERAVNPDVKFVFHQTWAYAQNSDHKGFISYGKNQMQMYKSIMDASGRVMKLAGFDRIVPSGTAIQNARTSFVGDNMCRDGYHLNLYIGRYTASCAWYEAVFGKSVIGNGYIPDKVSAREAKMAQYAAHKAVQNPFRLTRMKKFVK